MAQDGQFYLNAAQKAQFAGEGDVAGTSYTATATGISTSGAPFQNGSNSASFTFNGSVTGGGSTLSGAYSGASESGTYVFNWNGTVSSLDASLATVAGTYRDPFAGAAQYTLTISANGALSFASTAGTCTLSGEIEVLDSDWNYYGWEATAAGCMGVTGPIEGHAWMLSANEIYLFGSQSNLPIFLHAVRL